MKGVRAHVRLGFHFRPLPIPVPLPTHLKDEDLTGLSDDDWRLCRDHKSRGPCLGDVVFQTHDLLDAGQRKLVGLEVLLTTPLQRNKIHRLELRPHHLSDAGQRKLVGP